MSDTTGLIHIYYGNTVSKYQGIAPVKADVFEKSISCLIYKFICQVLT